MSTDVGKGPRGARRAGRAAFAVGAVCAILASGGEARGQDTLRVVVGGAAPQALAVADHRGYASIPARALEGLGWSVAERADGWLLTFADTVRVEVTPGNPFVLWQGVGIQLVAEPYTVGDELYLPLPFVTDVLPDRLPGLFRALGPLELDLLAPASARSSEAGSGAQRARRTEEPPAFPPSGPARIVVIDPGHGGVDPGAIGPKGTREKDVVLRIALALADELRSGSGIEVHLTRDRDSFVPLWERGALATRLKGERPGIFVSIHTNALPDRRARGVETYFLSEARTEDERRVAALENAALALDGEPGRGPQGDPDLDFILGELRNLDHQHWSAELAQEIQRGVASVHPGPDRGVKQGPFAVITNALMPAVLVEIGFITNPSEERALRDPEFVRSAAHALAVSIVDFFARYPPGRGGPSRGNG